MFLAECFDLDIHACGQIELHQRIHCLLRGLEDIEQTFVRTNFELLTGLFIHVRRTQHAVFILHRGQWNRARDLRSSALRRFDDLTRGLIQDAIVVRLKPDTNSFFSNHVITLSPSRLSGRKDLAARLHTAL